MEEIKRPNVELVKDLLKVRTYPLYPRAGMTCGKIEPGVSIEYPEMGFFIACTSHRSQVKNKEVCLNVLEIYLRDYK